MLLSWHILETWYRSGMCPKHGIRHGTCPDLKHDNNIVHVIKHATAIEYVGPSMST